MSRLNLSLHIYCRIGWAMGGMLHTLYVDRWKENGCMSSMRPHAPTHKHIGIISRLDIGSIAELIRNYWAIQWTQKRNQTILTNKANSHRLTSYWFNEYLLYDICYLIRRAYHLVLILLDDVFTWRSSDWFGLLVCGVFGISRVRARAHPHTYTQSTHTESASKCKVE